MEENKIIEETTVQTADIDDTQFDETTKVDCENNSKSKWERRATKKDFMISLVIVLTIIVIGLSVILGCVFGIATTNAKKQANVEILDGAEWSKTYLCAWLNDRNELTNNNHDLPTGTNKYELIEFDSIRIDKDLKVERPIENSHYTYTYTFVVRNEKYNVTIDAKTGAVLSVEIA